MQILPKETREVDLGPSADVAPAGVRLAMVLFEDLSFEGAAGERDLALQRRERGADVIEYSLKVFEEARTLPLDKVEAFLEAKRSERAARDAAEGRGSAIREVDQALAALRRSPETFLTWLSGFREMLGAQRIWLLRHRS